ncbi:uncharacterized protein LOC143606992 [Bidens hawaiensis]|uniref:uncharacterized protein LOC143606992 n=1 Tax=Bidens hawaiensis TaxID=980011 RepID=UPI00404948AE
MLANLLPSLGLMGNKELLMNIVALGILVITVVVNTLIQNSTRVISIPFFYMLTFTLMWPFSVALTVSTLRKKLQQLYKESQVLVSSHPEKKYSSKELKHYVKKYWMMTLTSDPQFAIACSPVSCAFGVICITLTSTLGYVVKTISNINEDDSFGTSEYKWSIKVIFVVQSVGAVVGCIAPVSRCFTSMGHYNLSKKWGKNQLNVFLFEKHWIQRLQQWKRGDVSSHISSRQCKIFIHKLKNTLLNFCITLQIAVLVVCKTICLGPRTLQILFSFCSYFFNPLFKKFKLVRNESLEIEEYTRYVVQIEEDAKLSNRVLRNTLHSITQLLYESEKKEPRHLIKLLEKSLGVNVVQFCDVQVPHLYPKRIHNCWSLAVVTLTSIVIALPDIENGHFKELFAGFREGLQFVRDIEESLYVDDHSMKARKAARCVWTEVDVYGTWLQRDLKKNARRGITSKETLKWLHDEAEKIMIQFESSEKPSIDHSGYKYITASSMCRITQSILFQCDEQEHWSNDEELLELISIITGNVFLACFTNLPRAIKMKCHHHAIEKREESIRSAAQLLGKSKKILKILKAQTS